MKPIFFTASVVCVSGQTCVMRLLFAREATIRHLIFAVRGLLPLRMNPQSGRKRLLIRGDIAIGRSRHFDIVCRCRDRIKSLHSIRGQSVF